MAGVADLDLEINFNDINGVVLDRVGEFSVTVTNLGPDVAGSKGTPPFPIAILASIIQDNGSSTPEIQFAASSSNDNTRCFFSLVIGSPPPGGSVSYGYDINIPQLGVNETIECHGLYSTHFNSGTREITWSTRNSFDTDPVPGNNSQAVTFGIPPISVPINQPYFLILLSLLFLIIGVKYYRPSIW